MSYSVEWSPTAEKRLSKLETKWIKEIVKKVEIIKENPVHYSKKLENSKLWRLRVGDYRVIIDIDFTNKKIIVLSLGHRKEIYK